MNELIQPPEGISLVQLALLQRRLRAEQSAQIAAAAAAIPVPAGGEPGQPPEHQWDGTRLRFQYPDGSWGEWVELRPKVAKPKDGEDGEPGTPPAHQISGQKLRFQTPDGGWGKWIDLRPKSAFFGGGGSDWNPDSLPGADDTPPDELIVKQNGAWARASLAQVQIWLGAALTVPDGVTINGVQVVVGTTPMVITPPEIIPNGVTVNGDQVVVSGIPMVITPAAPAAAADELIYPAGEVLAAGRMVVLDSADRAIYADHSDLTHANKVLGITVGAAAIGADATIRTEGEATDPSWAWTPGGAIWLGADGMLTQTPPTTGFSLIVGFSVSATKCFINLREPIVLI